MRLLGFLSTRRLFQRSLGGVVTPGNRYDSPLLPSLVEDLEAEQVAADAAYDSKADRKAVEAMGAKPVIALNPRRSKRRKPKHRNLFRKRYLVEQFNSLIKNHVLKGCWTKPRGMLKKGFHGHSRPNKPQHNSHRSHPGRRTKPKKSEPILGLAEKTKFIAYP